ncbi:hypothetical protein [Caballeronia udeis]|uniref:hypothetical protein n=1 Tax=Caballeronia udeis TaxID=1232866 RepID=UPI003850684B
MTMLAMVAKFERDLIIERTPAGLAGAKAVEKKLGLRDGPTPEQKAMIRTKLAEGESAHGLAKEHDGAEPRARAARYRPPIVHPLPPSKSLACPYYTVLARYRSSIAECELQSSAIRTCTAPLT